MRKEEVAPINKKKTEIQNKYNPFIQDKKGKASQARQAIKDALKPYMVAKDKRLREEAEAARLEAEAKTRAAQDALQRRDTSNLEEVEAAEELADEARQAYENANQITKQSSAVKGEGRAKSLITTYEPNIVDVKAAGRWAWEKEPERFHALILKIAQEQFNIGNRSIAGIEAIEKHEVRG